MNIQDALKETGKAECDEDGYVFVDEYGILRWYDTVNNTDTGAAELNEILNSDWLPYHEEKEIRPEEAGELWGDEYGDKWATVKDTRTGRELLLMYNCLQDFKNIEASNTLKIIHNKNGWTRLFPPVEDESVERMRVLLKECLEVINELRDGETCDHSVGICWCGIFSLVDSIDKILEIPKDI
jgi:hypothetical protein